MSGSSLPSFFPFLFVFLNFCSHNISVAGVPALQLAGSAIGVQTLSGTCIILIQWGRRKGFGVRGAWACLRAGGGRDEVTAQPGCPLTHNYAGRPLCREAGLEQRRGRDLCTLPSPGWVPRWGFIRGVRLPCQIPAKALNRVAAALGSAMWLVQRQISGPSWSLVKWH